MIQPTSPLDAGRMLAIIASLRRRGYTCDLCGDATLPGTPYCYRCKAPQFANQQSEAARMHRDGGPLDLPPEAHAVKHESIECWDGCVCGAEENGND